MREFSQSDVTVVGSMQPKFHWWEHYILFVFEIVGFFVKNEHVAIQINGAKSKIKHSSNEKMNSEKPDAKKSLMGRKKAIEMKPKEKKKIKKIPRTWAYAGGKQQKTHIEAWHFNADENLTYCKWNIHSFLTSVTGLLHLTTIKTIQIKIFWQNVANPKYMPFVWHTKQNKKNPWEMSMRKECLNDKFRKSQFESM